ncbi:uncharacterized protein LOC108201070 [Daucus carota subsp. sativus]|uniref:uncharacterized protein LOC108201070 n=1 Tax=Daucus carota subsp. sativus TaxID=79200 RepID=UPI0007EFD24D|nr:PREDICTED: uncharacterized protein LOC108201070 [Daucus carota subsp. sativus]
MWDVEDGDVWLLDRFNSEPDDVLIKIAVVLWGIWFARNKRIFENTNLTPAMAMNWSKIQVEEWRQANKKLQVDTDPLSSSARADIKWKPPSHGVFKVNVDAAVTEGRDFFAVGMVLRNNQGQFLAGRVMRFAGHVPVVEAEMVGVIEAISWANQLQIPSVIVETDSQLCANAIKGENSNNNLLEIGNLIQQCKALIRSSSRVLVDFVRKQANRVAHQIAKIPCMLNGFSDFTSPPSCLLETIMSDFSLIN